MRAKTLLLVVLALASCAASSGPKAGLTITLDAEQAAQCSAGGGCAVITQAELRRALRDAAEAGARLAKTKGCEYGT